MSKNKKRNRIETKSNELGDNSCVTKKEGFFSRLTPGDWINLVGTIISAVLVLFTLFEMQKERDTAYRPYIVMNAIEETAEWDSEGDLLWLKNYTRPSEITEETDVDGTIHGTITLPMTLFKPSSFYQYSVVNIGAGAATEVTYSWYDTNSQSLYDYLCSIDSKYKSFYQAGASDVFDCNNNLFVLDKETTYRQMYIEPNSSQTLYLDFPAQYSLLTGMIMKNYKRDSSEQLPNLFLNVEFKDIQNKSFAETVMISISMVEKSEQSDGSGSVTYQYNPHLVDIREIKK